MGIFDRFMKRPDGFANAKPERVNFTLKHNSVAAFAADFAKALSLEQFVSLDGESEISSEKPLILVLESLVTKEYLYIVYAEELTEERLDEIIAGADAFVESLDKKKQILISTILCVEKSSPAFLRYGWRQPRTADKEVVELIAGLDFEKQEMRTTILSNCPAYKMGRTMRNEFLRIVRIAENYF